MKKFIIFLLCLFVIAGFVFSPEEVGIRKGLTENFIFNIETFSFLYETSKEHLTLVEKISNDLQNIKIEYTQIPDTFENSGTIKGIFQLLKAIELSLILPFTVILRILEVIIQVIVDAVLLVLTIMDFFRIFTITQ